MSTWRIIAAVLLFLFLNSVWIVCAKSAEIHSRQRRLAGGTSIDISQAEYQVSIRIKSLEYSIGYGYGQYCNGALISQRVVLTAAHCLWDGDTAPPTSLQAYDFTLVMGTNSLYNVDQYTQQYDVLQLLPNPNFDLTTYTNDVALMFFNGFVPWNSFYVQAVALNTQPVMWNASCLLTSWGETNTESVAPYLNAAYLPLVNNTICATNYGSIPYGMLCAGYMYQAGIGTCYSDDGAPLVCNHALVGIDSWGNKGCGATGLPGVFTNISYYFDWITYANSTLDYTYYINRSTNSYYNRSKIYILATIITIVLQFLLLN